MNKQHYRLVFNKLRGILMAVAEHITSSGKSTQETRASRTDSLNAPYSVSNKDVALTLKPIHFAVLWRLGLVSLVSLSVFSNVVYADISADHTAPANQRPVILNAPNGVPLVNIQTPSAAGVSRNTYSQFDVNTNGAILNNSRTNVQTQLGGFVQGNPYLATGSARIILNEVNSQNISLLNGYVELAGSRAQVIIANPVGISCGGCGFINASRATLTTGTPIMNGGDLIGYRVSGGAINFFGTGLDTRQTDYTDIIARAVNVNAGIWASNLNVISGSNQVDVDSDGNANMITPISGTGSTPSFAVDVAALGGMYAGKIHLIGTESGVGVRNAGVIGASAGDVVIDANGMLINSGSISSTGTANNVALQAQSLNNSGTISSQNNLSIHNQDAVQNSGLMTADRELKIDSTGALTNSAGTLSGQRLDLTAASLTNLQGTIRQTGLQALSLTTQNLNNTNSGLIGNLPLDLSNSGSGSGAGAGGSTPPSTAAGGDTVVITPITPVALADGVITIHGDAKNDGGQITANGSMSAFANNMLNNNAVIILDKLSFTGTSFSNANGKLNVAQANINTTLFDNSNGEFIATNTINLLAHDLVNYQGSLQQLGTTDLTIDLLGNLDNTQGHIETNANAFNLNANSLTNTAGSIVHAGFGALTIHADTLSGTKGAINTNGTLGINATTAILDQGTIVGKQINLDTATLSKKAGQIIQTGTGVTSIKATTLLDNSGGGIASNGDSTYTVGDLNNQGGLIQAAGTSDLSIHATGALDNSALGKIQTGGIATLTAASISNHQGQITAGNTLMATAVQGLDNSLGLIAADQQLAIAASDLNNSSGTLASVHAGTHLSTTTGAIDNTLGNITVAQSLNTSSFGFNNTNGTLLANDALLNSQSLAFNNTNGTIMTAANLDLQSGALLNDAGLIQSGSHLSIDTHGQTLTNTNSGSTKGILTQGTASFTTGNLNNQTGYMGAKGTLTANSAVITNANGLMSSEAAISLNGTSLDNQTGRIESLANVDVSTTGVTNNQSGLLRSGQTLTLTAANIDNRNTQSSNQGLEGQNVAIVSDAINNNLGAIRADNLTHITDSGSLNNTQGLISSSHTLNIADRLALANNNVAAKTLAITNTGGTLIAGTNLSIDSMSLTGDGKVLSTGDLSTKLTSNFTQTAEWQADGNATFVTTGTLINQAKLSAGNALDVTAATIDNRAGAELVGTTLHLTATDTHTLINRGLINGGDTFIDTATLNNIGTGRIYGDHVAINATTLTNDTESVNGVTSAAVIAARSQLDIGATTITNREHAMLFSAGDMAIGGSLDANHLATGSATTLNNNSATIEALGNLSLNVANINNTNEHFSTQDVLVATQNYDEFQGQGGLTRYTTPSGTQINPGIPYCGGDCFNAYASPAPNANAYATSVRNALYQWVVGGVQYRNAYRFVYNSNITETQMLTSDPGQIQSGGTMQINANNVLNDKSKIVAGGALTGVVGNLNNTSVSGQRTTTDTGTTYDYITHDPSGGGNDYTEIQAVAYNPAATVQAINLMPSEYAVNTAITGSGTTVASLNTTAVSQTATGANVAGASVNNAGNQSGSTQVGSVNAANATATSAITKTFSPNVTLPNNSLFHTNPNSSNHYLIEADPAFADYRTWLSSDYMLSALSYDPATTTKRLGDGFYEQKLIREQVAQLTGRRFLDGFANDEAEYQALMNNGVTNAKAFNLTPGVALSATQIAQLTSDIVWLVQQTVTLADGSTTQALVPQVYVRVKAGDLNSNGALISADSVNLHITGDLNNTNGTIAGRTVLTLNANNVNNLGGRLTANDVSVAAQNDLNNLGGQIDASNSLVAIAGHDLNVISTTSMQTNAQGSRTNINRVAGLYVTGNQGLLVASAGNDIHFDAAQLTNNGKDSSSQPSTIINAGHYLTIGSVASNQQRQATWNSKNTLSENSTQDHGSNIQSAGDISLHAGQDLNIKAATIDSSQGSLNADAGRNISIATGQSTANSVGTTSYGYGTTNSTATATTQATSSLAAANNINLQSGADTHLTSTNLNAGKAIDIAATGNLTVDAAKDTSKLDYAYNAKNKRDIIHNQDETVLGSNINAGNNISLTAKQTASESATPATGGNLTLNSANITSQTGAVALNAAQDVTIGSTTESHASYAEHYSKGKSLFSSKSRLTIDQSQSSDAIGSTISGDSINVNAGKDINVQASNVVGTNDVSLNAQNNVNIASAQNTLSESHLVEEKKSGLMSSGGIGFTIGKRQLTTTNDGQQVTNTASTIGSINGDVNINAGKHYTQTGSDVLAPQGDPSTSSGQAGNINITAQQVDIVAAENTNNSQQTTKFKQSGLTVSLSSPVISAIQTAQQMVQAASQTKDTRMQALAAGTTALAAKNAADAMIAGNTPQLDENGLQVLDANGNNTAQNPANQVGGINVSISIGSSQSSSNSSQTSTNAASSHVTAGNNISIKATGDKLADGSSNPDAGNINSSTMLRTGDINIIGSQVKPGNNVTLDSQNNINLQAAQNTSMQTSTNKSSSGSIGVSVGTSGFAVTASASKGKGNSNGTDTSTTETLIQGGNKAGSTVTLNSGTDTNLIGAQVTGKQVIANVGTSGQGNLNIQSLQDTSTYTAKQSSTGISISVPIGPGAAGGSINLSKSNTNSHYASVNEQSGIMAGDGGFQVNTYGNTNLTGAVIASSQEAIDNNKNSITTQTLTTSNIENQADYKASSMGISTGVGLNKQADGTFKNAPTASAGLGRDSGNANSVTVSGISGGTTVSINNPSTGSGQAAQTALTGKDVTTTVDTLNRDVKVNANGDVVDNQGNSTAHTISPIFDQNQIEQELNAQVQITQAFSQQEQQFQLDLKKKVDVVKAEQSAIADTLKNSNLTDEQRTALIVQGLNAQSTIEQLEKASLLFSAVSGGLTAPTSNIGGIVAATLAPAAAYQIGQYFKDNGTEGSAPHALAHGILASAVAELGGNNPLGAALSAMSGEAVAPLVADLLYGKPATELNAEQKATVSIIASLGGIAASASVDNSANNLAQASQSAQNAVDNNWGMVGHYSTMATVLYLAGFSPKDAKAVALAAWGPDTDRRSALSTNSIGGGLLGMNSGNSESIHLLNGEDDPAKVIATQQALAGQVGEILRTIKQYENDPAKKAAYLTSSSVQNILHSFGDSFAHVQKDGTHYSSQIGHLTDGTDPDNPNIHTVAYRGYVNALFDVASQATASIASQSKAGVRVDSDTINNLIDKVTATTEKEQKATLQSTMGSISSSTSSSLVNSPVKDCGEAQACANKPVGSQVNPQINKIYGR